MSVWCPLKSWLHLCVFVCTVRQKQSRPEFPWGENRRQLDKLHKEQEGEEEQRLHKPSQLSVFGMDMCRLTCVCLCVLLAWNGRWMVTSKHGASQWVVWRVSAWNWRTKSNYVGNTFKQILLRVLPKSYFLLSVPFPSIYSKTFG